ncbi:uncharacterized protein C8Q71DRAFT_591066 [Rhodofomes roseus]|uniref:Uncharacterized protein n=1 Tax=Rhodofomes roseus TaxID=34475 RepID=A0ABQ8KH75_9APHY|nr:uncharacterized protein C8Q71DRAFT_591066 [Rhodofomes roseus]KAH9837216.1 hypothetical protein C8Q71DRAFT_591066 [Rhodofomes roseus]
MSATVDAVPGRPESSSTDRTAALAESSPYSLETAEAIGLVPETQTVDHLSLGEQDNQDIYRGGPPPAPPRSPSIRSQSSSSSSSSSASSVFGGRLGAISAVVEHAIATWARAWASSSSLSTTSSSSSSSSSSQSLRTLARSLATRTRRRRPSVADVHNRRSEREIAARIRAREEWRYVPRSFDLYVPNPLDPDVLGKEGRPGPGAEDRHFIHTDSLPLIIAQLGAALKGNERARRARTETIAPEHRVPSPPMLHHHYMMPEDFISSASSSTQEPTAPRRARKGKKRATALPTATPMSHASSSATEPGDAEKAWWLDISSPTWEDMRAIGKLLHLHPLTLEDILQQDPREKLEVFPRLGYYFVVFRAIESMKTRERLRALHNPRDNSVSSASPMEEAIVGEVNVYLIVFREGICSFHFSDIGEHVDRVRKKILKLSQSVNMSSDWIAHGVMDSIVDSFFPFLEGVEKEVANMESLLVSEDVTRDPAATNPPPPPADIPTKPNLEKVVTHDTNENPDASSITVTEKTRETLKTVERKTQFALPTGWRSHLRGLKRSVLGFYRHFRVVFRHTPTAKTTNTVHRMAKTRRLVTSLTRVLAHKSEVVAQLQKRLLTVGGGLGHGTKHDHDVYVYMGDVQDHILTLQQSLVHYERVLSTSQPTYLSHLRLSLSQAQSGTDTALVTLTTVSMGVLLVQTLIGLFSMNTQVPANSLAGNRFYVFGIVISLASVILFVYANFVRLWWKWSKRRRWRSGPALTQ